jgi:uncharacterized protein with von Willebrand factor type A (vWA) domain
MKEGFYRLEFIPPEEKNLHQFKGRTLKEVIEYLEGKEVISQANTDAKNWEEYQDKAGQSIFDGFLELLINKGVRVSTPEWLQFLQVISKKTKANELKELVETNELLNKVRLFAQTTLVKNKADEASFHEAFNEYFELAAKIYNRELQQKEDKDRVDEKENRDSVVKSESKEQLGIKEVKENLSENENHEDNEDVHGGKKDQHNDILKKEDLSKQGGGDKKEEPSSVSSFELKKESQTIDSSEVSKNTQNTQQEKTEHGFLVGGGKGKSIFDEQIQRDSIYQGGILDKKAIQEREKKVGKIDRRLRYKERPDKASMREVIRNIRRIILDVSEVKSGNIDLKRTVGNFAQRDFRFDYEREREKQPEIVLLIDVGGPVDEWSPLVKEVAEAMAKGLTKLEIYLFHNSLYGYAWKPDPKDLLASSFAKPNSLIDVKSIIKRRKKVIVYGDAEMSYSELEGDNWPPNGNDERVKKFGMGGEECLNFIKKKADSVVWINPIFQKEWEDRDYSGTIKAISKAIPMYDLTVGGVEDAIKNLMKI